MKKFIRHKDEEILFYRNGSKEILLREYMKLAFVLIVMLGFSIHCSITTLGNPPAGYSVLAWDTILVVGYALSIGLAVTYINTIIGVKTTRAILTNERLVYSHKGLIPQYKEIPLRQIKYSFLDDEETYINNKNGNLVIVMKNETKETLKNIQDAFEMDKRLTAIIVEEIENKAKEQA